MFGSGYEVDTASDGERALKALRNTSFDVVICDWKMPELNGKQVFERLLATNQGMADRLIFTTAT